MKLAIGIAHAAHRPERIESLGRMLGQLARHRPFVESLPGKPHEWSERLWRGTLEDAERADASHCLLLNDDVELCDNFMAVLERVIEARPVHLVGLYNSHYLAHEAVKRGLSWLTSRDGLVGIAYVLPTASLRAFLQWRATSLTDGTVEVLSEDQLLNLWAMAHGCYVNHTVPALVDHDVSVDSCYGNTQMRHPEVGPRDGMLSINWATDALHMGRQFLGNHNSLLDRVKGDRVELVRRHYEVAGDVV